MPCLLLPAPRPCSCLIASVSRPPHCKDRFLPPRTGRRPRLRLGVRMAKMARDESGASPEVGVSGEVDAILGGEESPGARREASRWAPVEAALNRMSKWLVAGSFAFAALWKHDAEIMWALIGAVVNSLLSQILKKMLNHERPASALRSDPGMPSSHAQSIFYAATILVLSLFYWLGTNYLTMILGPATLSMATYLSWLRVSQRLHTLNQVVVGAAVGSALGALWLLLWHSLVQEAFASSLLVKIAVILGSAVFCVGFVIYMIRHWLEDE
ncbi:lipid phosphate phosphatase epsilon 2, chloroplastic-like [Phragmites australis]|uniref:lipid phosphate phosphatase epsilon 2, chloroplastic-like n=1 Tax=Phragmites australis TaxID=29695 RepID=UPI002D79DFE4|nr:lipid phosphate phosphatase epsilon 2, chloroplastic-like [Phragmites australis]